MNSRPQLRNRPAPVSDQSAKADLATVAADSSAVLLKQMKHTYLMSGVLGIGTFIREGLANSVEYSS